MIQNTKTRKSYYCKTFTDLDKLNLLKLGYGAFGFIFVPFFTVAPVN